MRSSLRRPHTRPEGTGGGCGSGGRVPLLLGGLALLVLGRDLRDACGREPHGHLGPCHLACLSEHCRHACLAVLVVGIRGVQRKFGELDRLACGDVSDGIHDLGRDGGLASPLDHLNLGLLNVFVLHLSDFLSVSGRFPDTSNDSGPKPK